MNLKSCKSILINKKKGSSLIMVLIVFMIIVILATSVIYVNYNNALQTKRQENSIEAYYLSYSGIEMGYAALTANGNELFNKLKNGTIAKLDSSKADPPGLKTTKNSLNHIVFGNGNIDLKIEKVTTGDYKDWIKITSIGYVENLKVSKNRVLYINYYDPGQVVYEDN